MVWEDLPYRYFLLEGCNRSTFSCDIVKAVSDVLLLNERIYRVVTDCAGYCKKAHGEVLPIISLILLILFYMINLVADVIHKV